jgi:hypothetical protein
MTQIKEQTKKLINNLPFWTTSRQLKNSNLTEFLNVFGTELQDAEELIDYIFNQLILSKADTNFISKIYKASIPVQLEEYYSQYIIKGNGVILSYCNSFDEFFVKTNSNIYETITHNHPYYIEIKTNTIYFLHKYEDLFIYIDDVPIKLNQYEYQVWNIFDELGSLLGIKRLTNESNESFKIRIKDVFVHIGGSNKEGLINTIGRELGLREYYKWIDTTKDYIIENKSILINSISIIYPNGHIEYPSIFKDKNKLIIRNLKAKIKDVSISYIKNYSLHDLNNKKDIFSKQYYYNKNNTANLNLIKAAERLRKFCYNDFIWDQTFSQINPTKVLPSIYDASKEGFKKYNNMSPEEINNLLKRRD